MRIILSRKGFDSSYGGIPSPVIKLANGSHKIISLPIPSPSGRSDVQYEELNFIDGYSMSRFIEVNHPNFSKWYSGTCHLDPDLRFESKKNRNTPWCPAFGQDAIAQSVLEKYQVAKGDLFLFFGWFQFAEWDGDEIKFLKSKTYPNGFHMIFGYLQINDVFRVGENIPDELKYHPHFNFHNEYSPKSQRNNSIYKATERFSKLPNYNGANTFAFSEELILTRPLESRRTIWSLPDFFHPSLGSKISYNLNPEKWTLEEGHSILESAFRGQEFVVFNDPEKRIQNWAVSLIESNCDSVCIF